jgi:hypothetical protein
VPYYDRQVLPVPPDLPPGAYELGIKLYWYGDQQPLAVAADDRAPDSMLILGSYRVGS